MRYLPSLRSVPGLGLRLGLGLGLLLGSTGLALAITLLLFLATHDSRAVHRQWEVATETTTHSSELSRSTPLDADFQRLATLAPLGQLRYTFAGSCLPLSRAELLPGPVLYRPALVGTGPEQPYITTVTGPVSVVQRSWITIKTMFR